MIKSPICDLLGIRYPLFQGGMAWISDARLAAAVSNAGGLGLISAIQGGVEAVRREIRLCRSLTDKPFGVNIMLKAPDAADIASLVIEEGVRVVTTGAGSPAAFMPAWKEAGIIVVPVIPSVAYALKMQAVGADAVVAEGAESGGHPLCGSHLFVILYSGHEPIGSVGCTAVPVFNLAGDHRGVGD